MSAIKEMILLSEPPKSIWKPSLRVSYSGDKTVTFSDLTANRTKVEDEVGNILEQLVFKSIKTRWNIITHKHEIEIDNSYHSVRRKMSSDLIALHEQQCKALHPQKTRLGKWLCQSDFLMNTNTEKVVTELWKYITINSDQENHMENAFKILKALHAKNKDEYTTGTSRRRRSRW